MGSTFADEADHRSRAFECGWPARAETAEMVARRLLDFAQRLAAIDLAYDKIWPLFALRAIRPGRDPGPVLSLTVDELAALIDRRARADPPKWPAPVGNWGYLLALSANRNQFHEARAGLQIEAGGYWTGVDNTVKVDFHPKSGIWRDTERAVTLVTAMADSWDARWCSAFASIPQEGAAKSRLRPWIAWTAEPLAPRPTPPYLREFPYPFPFEDAGLPAEVRAHRGGELKIWP